MEKRLTACPLDCYDACMIEFSEDKLKGVKKGFTQGFLCPHLNNYHQFERIQEARYEGKIISINEAMAILVQMLKKSETVLHYRGRGNFALMQEITDYFFAFYGATLTNGSLCDGAGEAGVIAGRGHNEMMTPKQIAKADVVVFWGRNPHTTSSHILPLLHGKEIIVVDPVRTKIADMADLYVQLKPHGDMKFAMLLSRFLHIEGGVDEKLLQDYPEEVEEYYELTQTLRIKATLDEIGVTLGEIGNFLKMIKDKKVAILCGVGMQKYLDGADVMRAIDAFGVFAGLFGREGCGVGYMGDSSRGINSLVEKKAKKVSKVDVKFSDFETVFIQGANPLNQMPDTNRVKNEIKQVKNLIYFGLYENQTSQMADLVIPAKTFLEKDDIRRSYSSYAMLEMPKQLESEIGISEYDLGAKLCGEFGIEIAPQESYINHFKSFTQEDEDGFLELKGQNEIAYEDGFTTDDGAFSFMEEIDSDFDMKDDLFLLTCKASTSLNSQFKVADKVYLHPSLGYKEGERVDVSSSSGSITLPVALDERLREDCVLIYSGTNGVNNLTISKKSYEGNSAVFQQNKVKICHSSL